ncbi:MAG: Mov34/MPN/PAD-1 family protein [Chloroflexota bacterium]
MTSASTSSKTAVSPPTTPETVNETTHPGIQQLPQKQPPALSEQAVLHGKEPGLIVPIVNQAALAQIDAHSRSNTRTELGGALLGRAYRHENKVYLAIEAALPAVSADHGPVHFTFNADTWNQLRLDREQKYPNLEIVGWFHTHPNLGVFYSGDDVVVHSAAFTLPWHVGLVFDPVRLEACFFGWQNSELVPFAGFYELLDAQDTPFANWRVPRTTVWKDTSEAELAQSRRQAGDPTTVYAPPALKPSFNPGIGLIVGSLGLLLALFMLVGWVIPLNQQVNRLENVVLVMADEALAETNAAACPDPRLRILTPIWGDRYQQGAVIQVMGTTSHPDAVRYQVEERLTGAENWTLLNTINRSAKLSELASWNTTDLLPGVYELRLTAVDRNNIRLANTARCEIAIELLP